MAKMVKPVEVNVTVERGSGVRVTAELKPDTHERLKLEIMRRKRQGLPATVESMICEVIETAKQDWPILR